MGQAKRKLEEIRKVFLAELEDWAFPPTDWERHTVIELQSLPIVKVQRYPKELISQMRMKARQCHVNALFMEDNGTKEGMKRITGWWIQGNGLYILHSVVLHKGNYVCVTPAPYESESLFSFVPDSKIDWHKEGAGFAPYRDGMKIIKGVRANPSKTIADHEIIKQRLLSGMNPHQAGILRQ